ncbi:CAS/CSE protein [Lineolata rhizophorae]|uniref:CAS/CSE protein n=1 Tax=Lineolata rhizophorae TaxID=578093 RepID=A0A6A6NRS6_9PEZI|nr:CAS/CSE protein [Lineolata rhizophorae]
MAAASSNDDLDAIGRLLDASLDPRQNKAAELALRQHQQQPGYALALLRIVASDRFAQTTRLAGALGFKNAVRAGWVDSDGNHLMAPADVAAIKGELVGLMAAVPLPAVRAQLGEAVSIIADSDFWERWDTLVDDLVARLGQAQAAPQQVHGLLEVAHSIFSRWRPLMRSDALFTEINHVLDRFAAPLLALLHHADQRARGDAARGDAKALRDDLHTVDLVVQLLYDLSCQDLPPLFETNLPAIADLLLRYLAADDDDAIKAEATVLAADGDGGDDDDDSADPGALDNVRAAIFELLVLWETHFEEELKPLLKRFMEVSWALLARTGRQARHDTVVSRDLMFLSTVARVRSEAEIFNNESALGEVLDRVVLPNLTLRESDLELLEDEPVEFVRRDVDGSAAETRRRAATEFLRQLLHHFEQLVTTMALQRVNKLLSDYSAGGENAWMHKDVAVYLFSAVAARGVPTAQHGVTDVNPLVNPLEFFSRNVAVDLTDADANSVHPMLQVDAMRFLNSFRSRLGPADWNAALPLLVRRLASQDPVVYTYAAVAVERALHLTDPASGAPAVPRQLVTPHCGEMLGQLFALIRRDPAPEKMQQNEFLMRCVMRVLVVVKADVLAAAGNPVSLTAENLVAITDVIRHNPANPRFYYYHFEALGALIRFAAPPDPSKLEAALVEPLWNVLAAGVDEFVPYVLQLFAALLDAGPAGGGLGGGAGGYAERLVQAAMQPALWDAKGNVPALVRLLTSVVARGAGPLARAGQTEPLLGVFQKLVVSRAHEGLGFDLLEAMLLHFDVEAALAPYLPMVLQILFTKLDRQRTDAFVLRFVRLFHLWCARGEAKGLGTDKFVELSDGLQPGGDVFKGVYLQFVLKTTAERLVRPIDRKVAVLGLATTLADSRAFVDRYPKGWTLTCQSLLSLLINPPTVAATSDETIPDADVDDVSFGIGFTPLNTCRRPPADPFPEVADVKQWVGTYLRERDQVHGGRIAKFVQERLGDQERAALMAVMSG